VGSALSRFGTSGDSATINAITIRTAVPVAPWVTRRITLLGDIGANVALKDAMRLCRALAAADRGERPLVDAIHSYEADMLDYGFRAVRTSLYAMNQAIIESRVRSVLSRTALRVIDRVPAFKRAMFSRMRSE
jgi:2-polyprenyl-6-methoxyphenol hydroxylase-like FAD-dependent oxidoreductase